MLALHRDHLPKDSVHDMLIGIDPDGPASYTQLWKPVKGKHLLQLRDRLGKNVDEASFLVR